MPKVVDENKRLPWQKDLWQQIKASYESDRLPHAILLTGQKGVGKEILAKQLIKVLMCEQVSTSFESCGKCNSCNLMRAGTHPGFLNIEPDGTQIKIDQIRQLPKFVNQTTSDYPYKIILINPAEAMNISSFNALLKMLEEPAKNTIFILINHQIGLLPATIVSRCSQKKCLINDSETVMAWLAAIDSGKDWLLFLNLAYGSPLTAIDLSDSKVVEQRVDIIKQLILLLQSKASPITLAEKFAKLDLDRVVNIIATILADLIKIKIDSSAGILNSDKQIELNSLALQVDSQKVFKAYSKVLEVSGFLKSSANLNQQMLLEDLLISVGQVSLRGVFN